MGEGSCDLFRFFHIYFFYKYGTRVRNSQYTTPATDEFHEMVIDTSIQLHLHHQVEVAAAAPAAR
jgi:hypothetical protein